MWDSDTMIFVPVEGSTSVQPSRRRCPDKSATYHYPTSIITHIHSGVCGFWIRTQKSPRFQSVLCTVADRSIFLCDRPYITPDELSALVQNTALETSEGVCSVIYLSPLKVFGCCTLFWKDTHLDSGFGSQRYPLVG